MAMMSSVTHAKMEERLIERGAYRRHGLGEHGPQMQVTVGVSRASVTFHVVHVRSRIMSGYKHQREVAKHSASHSLRHVADIQGRWQCRLPLNVQLHKKAGV